jgi:hypothetical protein
MGKRVLILSASVGSGHVKAADALARAMRGRSDVDEVLSDDSLDHTNVLHKQFYSTLYKKLSAMLPEFLGWWYETSDDPWVADKGRLLIDLPQALPLINLVKEFRPDVILCTHFMPAGVISWLISNGKLDARAVFLLLLHQAMGEFAIRRKNHQSLAVLVEPSGAKKTQMREFAREHRKNGFGIVRVVVRANQSTGFMDGQRHQLLRNRSHGLSTDRDFVDAEGDFLPQGSGLAVDPHLLLRDESLGGTARAHACFGQEFLQSDWFGAHGSTEWAVISKLLQA